MIYLDNSATTRVFPESAEIAKQYMLESYFNPSAAYAPSVAAERDLSAARGRFASSLRAAADEIIFTSGGTESNSMAIWGTLNARREKGRVIVSAVEHPSIYEPANRLINAGYDVVYAPVTAAGSVDMDALDALLTANTVLVSVMHVNNETGAINDLAAISKLIRGHSPEAVFHSDGIQAFCKFPFGALPCDLYSISGHKFHAPKGVGALYVNRNARFAGGQVGGGQERGLRSGTENMPCIMAMDASLRIYRENQAAYLNNMRACKARLAQRLLEYPGVVVNGPDPRDGAPHILNVSFIGIRGEVLLHALEPEHIYVGTGSACSSHKKGSRTLAAMGITGERQEGAIRFSLCPFNTEAEMDEAAAKIGILLPQLKKYKRR